MWPGNWRCPSGASRPSTRDRVAHAIVHVIEHYLKISVNRYVDDIFGVIPRRFSSSIRTMILKLVTLCGFTLEPSKTPDPAAGMVVLGVYNKLKYETFHGTRRLYLRVRMDKHKATFWSTLLAALSEKQTATVKEIEKMAGRLCFTACAVIGASGLCRLHHFFKAASTRGSSSVKISSHLMEEIQWWSAFLKTSKTTIIPLRDDLPTASMFTDAEGYGGVGAVLFKDKSPPLAFQEHLDFNFTEVFKRRITNIIPLEMGAAILAALRFSSELRGHRVVFFIDNTSAMFSFKKGHCRADDLNVLVKAFTDAVPDFLGRVEFVWVPSAWNIADFPSRKQLVKGVCYVSAKKTIKQLQERLKQRVCYGCLRAVTHWVVMGRSSSFNIPLCRGEKIPGCLPGPRARVSKGVSPRLRKPFPLR